MIGILRHEHMGDQGVGGQAALDQPGLRRGLGHALFAGPAGVLRPAGDQDAELGRDHIQTLADVLADPVKLALAAGASGVVEIDDRLDPRQMRRQRAAVGPAGLGAFGLLLGRLRLDLRFAFGLDLFDIFQRQFQLVGRQRLGAAAEPVALERLDDLAEPFQLGGVGRALGDQRRLEGFDIVGNGD